MRVANFGRCDFFHKKNPMIITTIIDPGTNVAHKATVASEPGGITTPSGVVLSTAVVVMEGWVGVDVGVVGVVCDVDIVDVILVEVSVDIDDVACVYEVLVESVVGEIDVVEDTVSVWFEGSKVEGSKVEVSLMEEVSLAILEDDWEVTSAVSDVFGYVVDDSVWLL